MTERPFLDNQMSRDFKKQNLFWNLYTNQVEITKIESLIQTNDNQKTSIN